MDFWFFIFCVFDVDRFNAEDGGVPLVVFAEDAEAAPLAIADENER